MFRKLSDAPDQQPVATDYCDYCGSADVAWVKCKLICRNCRQIVKSCADLRAAH
jgi:hypothetical protein